MGDQKTILGLDGEAQRDNEEGSHYDYIRQSDRPISTRMSAAEIRAYGLVAVGGLHTTHQQYQDGMECEITVLHRNACTAKDDEGANHGKATWKRRRRH